MLTIDTIQTIIDTLESARDNAQDLLNFAIEDSDAASANTLTEAVAGYQKALDEFENSGEGVDYRQYAIVDTVTGTVLASEGCVLVDPEHLTDDVMDSDATIMEVGRTHGIPLDHNGNA